MQSTKISQSTVPTNRSKLSQSCVSSVETWKKSVPYNPPSRDSKPLQSPQPSGQDANVQAYMALKAAMYSKKS